MDYLSVQELAQRLITRTHPWEVRFVWICLGVFLGGLLLWFNIFRTNQPLSRRGAVAIGAFWTAFCTVEYWLLGPLSAIGFPDEYHSVIPWNYFLTHNHMGGAYAHGYAGGLDATAGMAAGTQYLSVERLAFSALPLWGTILFMKAGAFALAFSGGYRLVRSAFRVTRGKAVVIALVASGGHIYNFGWVMGGIGWAMALLPWVFYFLCLRSDRRWYFGSLVLLAIIYSGSTGITHSLPALAVAVVISCVLLPPTRPWRFVLGAVVFGSVAILNWLGVLIAVLQLSAESARATTVPRILTLMEQLVGHYDVITVPISLVALAILAVHRDQFVWRALSAMALAVYLGTVLSWIDWESTNIKVLAAYRWSLVSDGHILPALIILARALSILNRDSEKRIAWLRLPPLAGVYFASVVVLSASYFKALNILNYQYYGGQAIFSRVALLAECPWRPADPFRVVTVPSLFSPATATAYGLDTFDGASNNFPIRSGWFFGMAVTKPPNSRQNATYHFINLPAGATDLATTVNLDGLRIANVRYVLSDRPLSDSNLTLVSDRCTGGPNFGVSQPLAKRLTNWAPKALVTKLYIYELSGAWPRAFVPTEVRVSLSSSDQLSFYEELLESTERRIALVSRADAGALVGTRPSPSAYALADLRLIPDGFDLIVARRPEAGASPGMIVINAPYSRFWRARTSGRELIIVPVNGIQMGVVLEGTGESVEVRYDRPLLSTVLGRMATFPWSP